MTAEARADDGNGERATTHGEAGQPGREPKSKTGIVVMSVVGPIFTAAGLGGLAGGLYMAVTGAATANNLRATLPSDSSVVNGKTPCDVQSWTCQYISDADRDKRVGTGLAVAGAGAFALGVGLLSYALYLDGSDDRRHAKQAGRGDVGPRIAVIPSGTGLMIQGAF